MSVYKFLTLAHEDFFPKICGQGVYQCFGQGSLEKLEKTPIKNTKVYTSLQEVVKPNEHIHLMVVSNTRMHLQFVWNYFHSFFLRYVFCCFFEALTLGSNEKTDVDSSQYCMEHKKLDFWQDFWDSFFFARFFSLDLLGHFGRILRDVLDCFSHSFGGFLEGFLDSFWCFFRGCLFLDFPEVDHFSIQYSRFKWKDRCWFFITPGSMNRLFSDLFRKFEGVILGGVRDYLGVFGRDSGRKIGVKFAEKTPPK